MNVNERAKHALPPGPVKPLKTPHRAASTFQVEMSEVLARVAERLDELETDTHDPHNPADRARLKEMQADLLQAQTEVATMHSERVILARDVERIEGDDRGALVFLRGRDGCPGDVLVVEPSVIRTAYDVLERPRAVR